MSEIKDNRQTQSETGPAHYAHVAAKPSISTSIRNLIRTTWNPQPLPVPTIDPDLEKLPGLERITEVLRYQLLQIEYGLSNRGGLREWARVVVVFATALTIPATLVVPIVTVFLSATVSWTAMLFQIAQYLLYTLLTAVACVVVALAVQQGLRFYWHWRKKQLKR